MRPDFRSIVLTGLLASAGLGTAFAQTPSAPQPAPAAEHRAAGDRADPARREAMRQKHFDELKAKLRITAAQEGAWTSFTSAMRPPERDAKAGRPDRAEIAKLTTPQRIDRMQEMRQRHTAEADRRDAAVKTFYAALTPAQQQTFDALPPRMGQHGFGHGHGGPDGHGPRGGRPGPAGGEGQPTAR